MAGTLKVGVIGVGGIAKTHFPGWKESPHAELAALADVVPEALRQAGLDPRREVWPAIQPDFLYDGRLYGFGTNVAADAVWIKVPNGILCAK